MVYGGIRLDFGGIRVVYGWYTGGPINFMNLRPHNFFEPKGPIVRRQKHL